MSDNNLETLVQSVAKDWKENPYYQRAEAWTHIFWNADGFFRRLFDQLDLQCVIELACGHGRHSEQFVERAGKIILMDVQQSNIDASKKRLGSYRNVEFIVCNGYDFQPVKAKTVTAVFCYDAMVHFDPEVIRSYVKDTARVLKPNGMALYHHSNYDGPQGQRYTQNPHGRNRMNFELFSGIVAEAGLELVESNAIRWGNDQGLDRVSLLRKR